MRTVGRAELLVEELRRRWTGLRWGRVVLDAITLTSPSEAWPPTIRIDYRVGDKRQSWEDPWDVDLLREEPLGSAANVWLGIVHGHMSEQGLL